MSQENVVLMRWVLRSEHWLERLYPWHGAWGRQAVSLGQEGIFRAFTREGRTTGPEVRTQVPINQFPVARGSQEFSQMF